MKSHELRAAARRAAGDGRVTCPDEVPDRSMSTLRKLLVPAAATPQVRAWATIELMRTLGLNPRSYTPSEALTWAAEQACLTS